MTSFLLDQVFDEQGTFPLGLMVWPPFVFYRALGILNISATSIRKMSYRFSMLRAGDPVFNAILILTAEAIIVIFLAIYTTQVIPSNQGRSKPWHFPITELLKSRRIAQQHSAHQKFLELPTATLKDGDQDVIAEAERIRKGQYENDAPLVLENMGKTYNIKGKNPKEAVRNVTFAVDTGVVFGLLGPNGAGKTSLISILTGVYKPDSGTAKIVGFDVTEHPEFAFRSIGVCPQFDILWDDLTIEEHLYFYARIKGIAVAFENASVTAALQLVDLEELRYRQTKFLSGGERRRVSIAISLVSDPKVLVFDEPTVFRINKTGLDPEVRRSVWDTIARARANRAILMTTHSMEEADVCCQRIAIMAKGSLKCIGSPARLKQVYGSGYKLVVNVENPNIAGHFVYSILPMNARLLQNFQSIQHYSFNPTQAQLAEVFDRLVRCAEDNQITSWGISQTTLDEIFTAVISVNDADTN